MQEEELQQFKNRLEETVESSKDADKPVILDQTTVGRLPRMDVMQGQQMALATARRKQQQLTRIAGALRRIESGDLGFYTIYDEVIDPRRLALDPANTRCLR